MNLGGRLSVFLLFATSSLVCSPASAGATIATDSWEYEAPAGWTINREVRPAKSEGPSGELVLFSTQRIPLLSDGPGSEEARSKIAKIAIDVIQGAAADAGLKVKAPLQATRLAPELVINEIWSESTDGQSVLVQFAIIGPRAVVLITYEGRAPGTSANDVRQAILKIKWAA